MRKEDEGMYNAEMKDKYMESKGLLTKRDMASFFNKLAEYEEHYKKDVSDMALNEISYSLIQIQPKNESQSKVYCSYINGYRKWIKNTDEDIFLNVHTEFFKQFL